MPLFFLGTREWRNRQTRTVQVRVPVMEWGFNSPLAHDETADPLRICGFCFPWLRPWCCRTCFLVLLVVPRVFRALSGVWAGLLRGRWSSCLLFVAPRVLRTPEGPAAREARRPHFVRRRASKPACALRTLRRPPYQWGRVADVARRVVSKPGQVPPPAGTAAGPSGPSGAFRTCGAWCADGSFGVSARCPAGPHCPPARRQVPPAFSMPVGSSCLMLLGAPP